MEIENVPSIFVNKFDLFLYTFQNKNIILVSIGQRALAFIDNQFSILHDMLRLSYSLRKDLLFH